MIHTSYYISLCFDTKCVSISIFCVKVSFNIDCEFMYVCMNIYIHIYFFLTKLLSLERYQKNCQAILGVTGLYMLIRFLLSSGPRLCAQRLPANKYGLDSAGGGTCQVLHPAARKIIGFRSREAEVNAAVICLGPNLNRQMQSCNWR